MPAKRPVTVAGYIAAAPRAGQPQLRRLHALLASVAPDARQVIKWGTPFFVEPRFLFAFSAHKAHLSFTPTAKGLDPFRKELARHDATEHVLRIPYDAELPEALIRKIARRRLRDVKARKDDAFW